MKLHKGTIRPGTVREVLDNGVIKASAPGLFSFDDDPALMPPIMPWFIGHNTNAYSSPKLYDDVWIINFTDNPRQLYWFRKDRITDNINIVNADNATILSGDAKEENVEILCNREVGGDWATIYFSDGSGWIISKGASKVQIRPDGSILLTNNTPHRDIEIAADAIRLGTAEKSNRPVAYGDAVETSFMTLVSILSNVAKTALANPYTMPIGTTLMTSLAQLSQAVPEISSPHIKID